MKVLSKSLLALALASITTSALATTVVNQAITESEVIGAQKAWCQALVDISSTYAKDGQPAGIFIAGDSATSMGNVAITNKDGKVTTVDKTWTYVKDDAGKLRIVVHHSSLPYTGE